MTEIHNTLGLGSASLTSMNNYRQVMELLNTAFDMGIRHFDTAPLYGKGYSEKMLGSFIKHKRNQITITTKFGLGHVEGTKIPARLALWLNHQKKKIKGQQISKPLLKMLPPLLSYRRITKEAVQKSLEASLRRLGTDYLDVYLIHEGLPSFLDPDAVLYLMNKKNIGIIKQLGIGTGSNNLKQMSIEEAEGWDVLQYEGNSNAAGDELKMLFPNKLHFLHSCLNNIDHFSVENTIAEEEKGGYLLAQCFKKNKGNKMLFQTRRLEILKANIRSFCKYTFN